MHAALTYPSCPKLVYSGLVPAVIVGCWAGLRCHVCGSIVRSRVTACKFAAGMMASLPDWQRELIPAVHQLALHQILLLYYTYTHVCGNACRLKLHALPVAASSCLAVGALAPLKSAYVAMRMQFTAALRVYGFVCLQLYCHIGLVAPPAAVHMHLTCCHCFVGVARCRCIVCLLCMCLYADVPVPNTTAVNPALCGVVNRRDTTRLTLCLYIPHVVWAGHALFGVCRALLIKWPSMYGLSTTTPHDPIPRATCLQHRSPRLLGGKIWC